MKNLLGGVIFSVLATYSLNADAIYCDDCSGGSGEWSCRSAYVEYGGERHYAGQSCTFFYYTSGSYNPGAEYLDYWDRYYAGVGAFRYIAKYTIPNFIENKVAATCHSDVTTRWLHANRDVSLRNAASGALGAIPRDVLVKVSYDDGSYEIWKVLSQFSTSPLYDVPIKGPFNCVG